MMMKKMIRVALGLGLVIASSTTALAADTVAPPEDVAEPQVYVMNNHRTDVRVYAEDMNGKLHHLGRVARGQLGTFEVSAEVAQAEFRIKVFPQSPAWSPLDDDFGIKTNPLDANEVETVTMWLEADLARSTVEVGRSAVEVARGH
jgi:hypothetical protein